MLECIIRNKGRLLMISFMCMLCVFWITGQHIFLRFPGKKLKTISLKNKKDLNYTL